jgi:hypothetical protein
MTKLRFFLCTVLQCAGRAKLILRFIFKYKYPDWVMPQLQVTAAIDAALQMGYSPLKVRGPIHSLCLCLVG